jgi:hypothetical protein
VPVPWRVAGCDTEDGIARLGEVAIHDADTVEGIVPRFLDPTNRSHIEIGIARDRWTKS